jgi:hypothetical protein
MLYAAVSRRLLWFHVGEDVVLSMVEDHIFSISLLDKSQNYNYVDLTYLIPKLSLYDIQTIASHPQVQLVTSSPLHLH